MQVQVFNPIQLKTQKLYSHKKKLVLTHKYFSPQFHQRLATGVCTPKHTFEIFQPIGFKFKEIGSITSFDPFKQKTQKFSVSTIIKESKLRPKIGPFLKFPSCDGNRLSAQNYAFKRCPFGSIFIKGGNEYTN